MALGGTMTYHGKETRLQIRRRIARSRRSRSRPSCRGAALTQTTAVISVDRESLAGIAITLVADELGADRCSELLRAATMPLSIAPSPEPITNKEAAAIDQLAVTLTRHTTHHPRVRIAVVALLRLLRTTL